jgi:hypothetical protein
MARMARMTPQRLGGFDRRAELREALAGDGESLVLAALWTILGGMVPSITILNPSLNEHVETYL